MNYAFPKLMMNTFMENTSHSGVRRQTVGYVSVGKTAVKTEHDSDVWLRLNEQFGVLGRDPFLRTKLTKKFISFFAIFTLWKVGRTAAFILPPEPNVWHPCLISSYHYGSEDAWLGAAMIDQRKYMKRSRKDIIITCYLSSRKHVITFLYSPKL